MISIIDITAKGYQGALLIYQMLDSIAREKGYNSASDLEFEEPAVNIEFLQIVQERLIAQAELRRLELVEALRRAEEDVARSYV